ncbi:Extracytoplasmic solute receptor protein YiaO [Hartmannibacter diazotrophicus]|uniref:Extracytoplasmic solute receptor protein YiaO n=1 Tax=Hartmannibacter diazotrophicus TaxID=1482074 RepID=A0A2C9D8K9_9HYPH|nr:TRAP transporter substrate-binding protein [Hartmannibacter diazotrophicus]SON56664.1 Extracytoplasmic solute receptor protein YiaO [Hartmannibacter diazotrophicus]
MNLIKTSVLAAAALAASSALAMAAPREVRIASHVSTFSPLHAQSQLFAAEIEKRLPGEFDFKLFPGGQLGEENDLIANVQAGSIEMVNVASGVLKIDGKLGVFDLPWLFDDRAHVERAMAAGLEDAVRKTIEESGNVKVIGVYENGFRHVINTQRAINEPFDLDGLKIRIAGGKFRQAVFQDLGATPVSVPWGETFTALQSGVVDGAEAATYGFYEQKQYEVAGYLSLTSHVYTPSFLIASKAFYDSLTPEQQTVFDEVGRSITAQAYTDAAALEEKYLDEMKASLKVNPVKLKPFQEATAGSYDDYVAKYGEDFLKYVRDTAE